MEAAVLDCATDTTGARVDRNISSMTGEVAVPRSNGELVFDAPWQSRAFGMAVSLSQAGLFSWDRFRAELAKAIREQGQDGLNDYYHRWLDALEACLEPANLFDHEDLHHREDEYREHLRDEVF